MDGEFDRELDDGGWGTGDRPRWKLIREQMKYFLMAVGNIGTEKEKAQAKSEAEQSIK